jgi:hypothetical protein
MRKFILLLFLVFKLLQGYSQNVSLQTAQQVATNWYRHYAPAGKQMATISKTTEYKYRNATNFYH